MRFGVAIVRQYMKSGKAIIDYDGNRKSIIGIGYYYFNEKQIPSTAKNPHEIFIRAEMKTVNGEKF